ncbi:FAD-binding protein [Desulfohalovibrio reitneri]|uniref:FAD-binding protein n=1 Tax=Desulfohalovibrio reitneri TaxID=1307759 RepID=UPI000557DF64|nr:FAD-binding protein [Desulfohalovibrio reitneri]
MQNPPSPARALDADILVLGSGLAGLRAAWAALEENPGAGVVVASAARGPSGSSFANLHDRLGIQVCGDDAERAALVEDVLAAAGPGEIDPVLVEVLAAESLDRFRDLEDLGAEFLRDGDGRRSAFSACFSPRSRRAAIFTDLGATYRRFAERVEALGGRFLPGLTVRRLLAGDGRCRGALLESEADGGRVELRAEATIMALGGPAPLFAYTQAGPRNPGFSYGLLDEAGVELINAGYLQYMWASLPDRTFWNIAELARPGAGVLDASGNLVVPPPEIAKLAGARRGHCPYGFGLEDAALDHFLADYLDWDGAATVLSPSRGRLRVAPMAHAGNGGARVDAWGRTSLPGLYACGECASGMHGANRVGGAMVLATQVFGRRAGLHAAKSLKKIGRGTDTLFTGLANPLPPPRGRNPHRERLAWSLQRNALRPCPEVRRLLGQTREERKHAGDWRDRLALRTGVTLLNHFAANC